MPGGRPHHMRGCAATRLRNVSCFGSGRDIDHSRIRHPITVSGRAIVVFELSTADRSFPLVRAAGLSNVVRETVIVLA